MTERQIDCEQALRQVFEFIDHELGERDRAAMDHHLHTCKSCFSRVEFEQRLKEKLGALKEEKVASSLSARIKGLLDGF